MKSKISDANPEIATESIKELTKHFHQCLNTSHLILLLILFLCNVILSIDCQIPGQIDTDILSWIFTEEFIWNCLDTSMRTTDRRIKQSLSNFVNMICGSDVDDVSSVESQCECLLTAIVVCSIYL